LFWGGKVSRAKEKKKKNVMCRNFEKKGFSGGAGEENSERKDERGLRGVGRNRQPTWHGEKTQKKVGQRISDLKLPYIANKEQVSPIAMNFQKPRPKQKKKKIRTRAAIIGAPKRNRWRYGGRQGELGVDLLTLATE